MTTFTHTISFIYLVLICVHASAMERVPFGGQKISIPDTLPRVVKEFLEKGRAHVPDRGLPALDTVKKQCAAIPSASIRPFTIYQSKDINGIHWYSFHGNVVVAMGFAATKGKSWCVIWKKDGSLSFYSENDVNHEEVIRFHPNGCIASYSDTPYIPSLDQKPNMYEWTQEGLSTPFTLAQIPQNNDPQCFSAFFEWCRTHVDPSVMSVYPDEIRKKYLAGLMVRTDTLVGMHFEISLPARLRYEQALMLNDVILSYLEIASQKWTAIHPRNLYYFGRYLASNKSDTVQTLAIRLAQSEEEKIRLLGLAGLAGGGKLTKDTDTQGHMLAVLQEYPRKTAVSDYDTAENNMDTCRAKMAALIMGVSGNVKFSEEAMKQLGGDARTLAHAGALCDALGDVKYTQAIPLLQKLLADDAFRFPDCALRTLMRLGNKESFPLAVKRLESMKNNLDINHLLPLCDLAAELEALTGEAYYEDSARWKTWWEANKDTWVPPVFPEDVKQDEKYTATGTAFTDMK